MNSFKVTLNNKRIHPPNYIGLIQRWIKISENKVSYDMITIRHMTDSIVKYLNDKKLSGQLRSSEIKFNILKGAQRIVRAKYEGWLDIKNMKDFIPNPHPNKKEKKL